MVYLFSCGGVVLVYVDMLGGGIIGGFVGVGLLVVDVDY